MAGALRSCSGRSDDATISFLVVATGDLCERISEGLLQTSRERKCRSIVHQCESITEVVRLKPDLSVDFVVFAFDWRVCHSISEVEENIRLLDEHYILSGCACLINCTGVPQPMTLNFHRSSKICKKFNLILLTTNIAEPKNILVLGSQLLNLAEARVGSRIGVPMLPRPSRND